MLYLLSFAFIIASCFAFRGITPSSHTRRSGDNAMPNSLTKLNTGFFDATTSAIQGVIANPSSLILPAAFIAFGSVVPILLRGASSGESVYSLLVPALESIEKFLRSIPLVETLIRKFVLKTKLVFEDVSLPLDDSEFLNSFLTLTGTSQFSIVKFLATSLGNINDIVGKEKTSASSVKEFNEFHNDYVNYAVKPKGPFDIANTLPEEYKYFGNGDNFKNLPYFLKTNPFFTASLRSKIGSGFEIDPFGNSGITFMSQIISCLDDRVPRVAASFDADMNLIEMKVYSATNRNVELTGFDNQMAATALLYQCSFYAQNIHATTHVLHLLMTTGIVHSTEGTPLHSWAQPYVMNIYLKYVEVESLLFSKEGYLTGSGLTGYRVADRSKVLVINKEMLCKWGTLKTADEYVSKFLFPNLDPTAMAKAGLAEEFLKHVGIVGPYATAMDKEFQKELKYSTINEKLKTYMSKTGTGVSEIDSLKSWMELMSVSGILHGSTLSMSRLVLTHSFMTLNSPESTTFTQRDAVWCTTITGTILGALDDFHVFSNTLPSTTPYNVNRVLLEFDNITHDLKAKYFKKISEDAEIFENYGWILTDHGPNFVDGKQLTITTYI